MKKLLLLALLFISVYTSAQNKPGTGIPGYTDLNNGYNWLRGAFRSLNIPFGCGYPSLQTGQYQGSSALYLDTCFTGGRGRLYYKQAGTWQAVMDSTTIAGLIAAGGGGGSADLSGVRDSVLNLYDSVVNKLDKSIAGDSIGTIFTDYFNRYGVGANYDSAFSSTTITYNGNNLSTSTSYTGYGNYIRRKQITGLNRWEQSIDYVATSITSTSYGFGFGVQSANTYYDRDLIIQPYTYSGADLGKIQLYYGENSGNTIDKSGNSLSLSAGDTIRITARRDDEVITIYQVNLSTGAQQSYSYTYTTATVPSAVMPNTGRFCLWFIGGDIKILNWTVKSHERKYSTLVLGNSITAGYNASIPEKKYTSLVFGARNVYEVGGGAGDRSAEGILQLDEIKNVRRPKNVLLALGVNDAQNSVSDATYGANIRRIVDTLMNNGILPTILSNSPLSAANITSKNDTLKAIALAKGIRYVNDFDSLRSGTAWKANYTNDNLHPNDSGMLVRARIIKREAVELFGDTYYPANKFTFKSGLTDFVAVDPATGKFAISSPTSSAISGTTNYYSAFNSANTITSGVIYKGSNATGFNTSSPIDYGSTYHNLQVEGSVYSVISQSVAGSTKRTFTFLNSAGDLGFGFNNNGSLSTRGNMFANGNFGWGSIGDAGNALMQLTSTSQAQLGLYYNGSNIAGFRVSSSGQLGITTTANSVGINTNSPAASAALDITSTTKGVLFPRMTTTQQNAISSPASGLVIYNTDSSAIFYYNGSAWTKVGNGTSGGGTASTIFNTPNGHVTANTVVKALGTLSIEGRGDTTDNDNKAYVQLDAANNTAKVGSLSSGAGVDLVADDGAMVATDTRATKDGIVYGGTYDFTNALSIPSRAKVSAMINDSLNANARTIRAAQRTGYDSLATNFGDTALVIKATDVQLNNVSVTKEITDTSIRYNVVVTKSDVGLGNVDNTSDATKNSATATLTNKRWTPRVGSTTSSATPTINTDNVDIYKLTAQAADITSFTTNLSGTPVDGDILEIQITGTATRAITWGSSFVSSTVTLPTTTSSTATLTVVLQYFTTSSYGNNKWVCVNYF